MAQETHTFLPQPASLADFNPLEAGGPREGGEAIAVLRGMHCGAAAFIDLAEGINAEYTVPIAAQAFPGGCTEDSAFEYMGGKIIAAVKKGCDAVMLDLHGSMAARSFPDAEGELLHRIRAIAPEIPIAVALDFHCTITPKMVDNATVISIYRTTPHVDMYETGQRAGSALMRHLNGESEPLMVARRIPLMASLECMSEKTDPMKGLIEMLPQMEKDEPDILVAGLSGGHTFTDVAPGGMTAVFVTDNNPEKGAAAAEKLLEKAWENREALIYRPEPYRKTLEYAKTLNEGPVILADCGDNPSSGGFASDMTVVKAAIEMGFEDMAVGPICDPESAKMMFEAGVGSKVTLALGGKIEVPLLNYRTEPLEIAGTVQAVSDKPITFAGPILKGLKLSLGCMAVLSTGAMEIMVSEKRGEAIEPGVFSHVGIDPKKKKYTLIKSRQHYRAAYGPIARHMMWICGPGPVNPDFAGLPFQHIQRPMFPLDKDVPYQLEKLGKW
jgi:microcystin degradation protein MlrC